MVVTLFVAKFSPPVFGNLVVKKKPVGVKVRSKDSRLGSLLGTIRKGNRHWFRVIVVVQTVGVALGHL